MWVTSEHTAYFIFLESSLCCSWWYYLSITTHVYPSLRMGVRKALKLQPPISVCREGSGPVWRVWGRMYPKSVVYFTLLSSKSHPKPKHNFLIGFNPSNKLSFATSVCMWCTQFDSIHLGRFIDILQNKPSTYVNWLHGMDILGFQIGVSIFSFIYSFSVSVANYRLVLVMMSFQTALCKKKKMHQKLNSLT